ncbi:MAG: Mov34/MPN/PAD-1 family protein [Eggerthellaceae bacterium]|nr:Mov34/MPN/PAD-1 family protein [Eggerthellaceae bacterium]
MTRYFAVTDTGLKQINSHKDDFFPVVGTNNRNNNRNGSGIVKRAFVTEQGGALMGPIGSPLVTQFIFDEHARHTGTTYSPSADLLDQVNTIERNDPRLEGKGFLHSHPGNLDRPSGGDYDTLVNLTAAHPWLSGYLCPIVSGWSSDPSAPHVAQLDVGFMSVYYAERRKGGLAIEKATLGLLPVDRDSQLLARELNGTYRGSALLETNGQLQVYGEIEADGLMAILITPVGYPDVAPTLMVQSASQPEPVGPSCGSSTSQPVTPTDEPPHNIVCFCGLPLRERLKYIAVPDKAIPVTIRWDLTLPEKDRLQDALDAIQVPLEKKLEEAFVPPEAPCVQQPEETLMKPEVPFVQQPETQLPDVSGQEDSHESHAVSGRWHIVGIWKSCSGFFLPKHEKLGRHVE